MQGHVLSKSIQDRVAGCGRRGDREYQEDAFKVIDLRSHGINDDDALLLLLADGMGGHTGGSIASELAVEQFGTTFIDTAGITTLKKRFENALGSVNGAIRDRIESDSRLKGMGCTLIAAVVQHDQLMWTSVGDSLLWIHRNNCLTQLNDDHSMKPVLDAMVTAGEMTEDEALHDGRRNALRSAIDGNEPKLVDMNVAGHQLQPGDTIILASDGMDTLKNSEISDILTSSIGLPVEERLRRLLDAVIDVNRPYQDNTTAILLEVSMSDAGLAATKSVTRAHRPGGARQSTSPTLLPKQASPIDTVVPTRKNRLLSRQKITTIGIVVAACLLSVAFGLIHLSQKRQGPSTGQGTSSVVLERDAILGAQKASESAGNPVAESGDTSQAMPSDSPGHTPYEMPSKSDTGDTDPEAGQPASPSPDKN